jgi:hypothetical protein
MLLAAIILLIVLSYLTFGNVSSTQQGATSAFLRGDGNIGGVEHSDALP